MAASWPPPPVVHRYPRAAPQHATLRVAVRAVPALTCSLACVLPASVATDTIYHSNEPQNTPCKRLVSGQRRGSSNTLAMAPGRASLRESTWSRTTCVDGSESDVDKEHPSIEETALDEDLCAAGLFGIDAEKKILSIELRLLHLITDWVVEKYREVVCRFFVTGADINSFQIY